MSDQIDIDKDEAPSNRAANVRRRILYTADSYVNGDRNVQYGDPSKDFAQTAAYWTTYLESVGWRRGEPHDEVGLRPHDVGIMQALLKISRLAWSPDKEDHYVDLAGYAACAADCAHTEYGELK